MKKMQMNKVCDLSSISVFPPPNRRPNTVPSGLQSSQPRSQPSQQSLSQGLSSQHPMLSQLSQNSLDDTMINDQRVFSQEQEKSVRRNSCLPRLTYSREESQPSNLRSSSNLMRKWHSADHKSQFSEGLEPRIGMMETSLSRVAMILDSVQSDVMQINKGTKESNIEMECIRQKLITYENSLQLMIRGQEETKASIDGNLKSISEQICKATSQEKLHEVSSVVSTLPRLIEASMRSLHDKLQSTFTKEIQALSTWELLKREMSCCLKHLSQNELAQSTLSAKKNTCCIVGLQNISNQATTSRRPQPPAIKAKISLHASPKVEMEGGKPVKKARVNFSDKFSQEHKKKGPYTEKYKRGGRDCAIIIESDEETAESCSSLVEERADLYGNYTKEDDEEAQRIIQKARRRRRKHRKAI